MIFTTGTTVEGRRVEAYLDMVFGKVIVGTNLSRDLSARISAQTLDIAGERSGVYEAELRQAREMALREVEEEARRLGADAVIGIDVYYGVHGPLEGDNSMFIAVIASGIAVRLAP